MHDFGKINLNIHHEEQTKKRRDAAQAGIDHERLEQLEWTAEECDKWDKKRKRKNPDVGFDSKR